MLSIFGDEEMRIIAFTKGSLSFMTVLSKRFHRCINIKSTTCVAGEKGYRQIFAVSVIVSTEG